MTGSISDVEHWEELFVLLLELVEPADVNPLRAELNRQRADAIIGQHALPLRCQDGGIMQPAFRGKFSQFLIGRG